MAHGRCDRHIREAIERLEGINDEVQDTKRDVHEFLDELREEMRDSGSFLLENAYFAYSGSSYERTAVSTKTDFDISVVLSTPFEAENFTLIGTYAPGFFKLRPLERDDYQGGVNYRGFLKVQELKEDIIDELIDILRRIRRINANWTLRWSINFNSIHISMRVNGGAPINIDLVPVLRGRSMEDVGGFRFRHALPYPLAQRNSHEYHLILGAAPFLRDENYYHLLTTIAFAEMEKICMKSSRSIQNAVRLVKLSSVSRGWKRDFGLRAFHIKRIAIKNFDELNKLNDWEAYISLLKHLSLELSNGVIDGYFLNSQNIYFRDLNAVRVLAWQIGGEANTIQPHHLRNLFTH